MTTNEAASVLLAIRGIWRQFEPSTIEKASWMEALVHWDYSIILSAIKRLHQTGTVTHFGPQPREVMSVANEIHRSRSLVSGDAEKESDWSAIERQNQQDDEAAQRFLDQQDVETLATAHRWLDSVVPSCLRQQGENRITRAWLMLAIQNRLWEPGDVPWYKRVNQ